MYGEELTADIVIVGSGVGGATFARTVAPCGAKILIVERGEYLKTTPEMLNEKAIHRDGAFIAQETWYENHGKAFSPWIYYYVGGNTKFFGAVMPRYRKEDFEPVEHIGGISPAWPFLYEELEPYYGRAEELSAFVEQAGRILVNLHGHNHILTQRCQMSLRLRQYGNDWSR